MQQTKFKIVLLGDARCGKTTFVQLVSKGKFTEDYAATRGVEITPVSVKTSLGIFTLEMWDCAGNRTYRSPVECCKNSDAAIIFFDASRPETEGNFLNQHLSSFRAVDETAPIFVCKNKIDLNNSTDQDAQRMLVYSRYELISCKTNRNCRSLLLDLLQTLVDPKLKLC